MKKNRLTLYIVIALVLGVGAGYFYNTNILTQVNNEISTANAQAKAIDIPLNKIKDTTSSVYLQLKTTRAKQAEAIKKVNADRDDKLEGFAILSDVFLRLIKMIVAPLIFTTLVVGVAKVGDIKAVGRIGGRTLLLFIGISFLSLLVGMLMVNFFEPGSGVHLSLPATAGTEIKKSGLSLRDFISHVFPRSITEAMANNEILQVVVFSLFFGVATAAIGEKGEIITKFMDAAAHVIMKITTYVMKLAPLGVFGAITVVVAKEGLGIIATYATFIGEFYIALALLWLMMISGGYAVLKKRVLKLLGRTEDAILVAFSTSTSEAAFPRALEELERFGCDNKIVSFVLPLGYSFNLVGSMMYLTFALLFLAQAYGMHPSFGHQLSILLILMLMSKGVAGVPRGALVVLSAAIGMFSIPDAGLALLLGIDPLLDMGRSATNVLGNVLATAVVSKWEGELDGEAQS
ncbi:MAG TPA: cation:dicarboxylase symporter family transporter [Mucilaginibacter sp.]|nr:cation:dicarboxylase symporter family transporter [Mucilaginibacter sp.]